MTPPTEAFKWRHSPDAPMTVSAAAFARLVAENDLKPIEVDGYLWAWLPTEDGFDAYRAVHAPNDFATTTTIGANPAAGANPATLTVPVGKRWRVLSLHASLATDATVISRIARVTITDGTNTQFICSQGTQAASSGYTYVYGIGLPYLAVSTNGVGAQSIPDVWLNAGATVALTAVNLQAGDDWSAMSYTYQEVSE